MSRFIDGRHMDWSDRPARNCRATTRLHRPKEPVPVTRRRASQVGSRPPGLVISKMPFWQRWRRITAHLGVPVSPRPRINDPRRCPVQRLAKIRIRNILANRSHIFVSRVCHGIRHESDWVCERPLWRLEPDDSWRDIQYLRCGWNRFHSS